MNGISVKLVPACVPPIQGCRTQKERSSHNLTARSKAPVLCNVRRGSWGNHTAQHRSWRQRHWIWACNLAAADAGGAAAMRASSQLRRVPASIEQPTTAQSAAILAIRTNGAAKSTFPDDGSCLAHSGGVALKCEMPRVSIAAPCKKLTSANAQSSRPHEPLFIVRTGEMLRGSQPGCILSGETFPVRTKKMFTCMLSEEQSGEK